MDNSTLVSIIIPVYNTEKYLRRCIDSLINQTYPNLEIIAVNDGSTDKCKEILNEYAQKDKRIIVIDKNNGGISSARNLGISRASGEYITFLDSDDWVDNNYYYELLEFSSPSTQLICGGFQINGNGLVHNASETITFESIPKAISCLYNIYYGLLYNIWGKLFKKNIIDNNNIYFQQSFREDGIFLLDYMYYTNIICIVSCQSFLHYNTENSNSFTHKNHGIMKTMLGLFTYYNSFNKLIEKNGYAFDEMNNIINMDKTHSFCEILHETYPLTFKQKLYWYKRMIDQLPHFTYSKYLTKRIHKRLKWAFDLRSPRLIYLVVKLHLIKLKLRSKLHF